MANDTDTPEMDGLITQEPLARAIGDRYLQYALSTIMHRALPDARDGLKPVHRRILFAMRGLRLDPNGAFRKCAKIVGEVMGNYHPHGDQAIYDALARLAQDFAVRYPLVDGQGNFGNVDGDNPAAQRYTEARMTAVAAAMMEGLAENAVDFRPNYDGSEEEPEVLPGAFPNLLANGSSGIAVGMATNIPPHNVAEVIDAALYLIKTPNAGIEKLVEFVPGPDFPTGGTIVEPIEQIREAYATGRGAFRLRAVWEREELGRGQWQIVVTEIPYQVAKSKLIERIADLINTKKLPILADIRDESAEDIRIVLEPKARTVDPATLMEALFKATDLETRFSLNMNVLIDGRTPQVCSLREVLRAFLDHQRDVLIRRSTHRMDKIDRRLEVLEGYIVAFLNLDRVIEIIRYEDEPKLQLMAEFELTEVQAEAILNMRLRSLRKLEEMELRNERDALIVEREGIVDLLGSEDLQWGRIAEQLRETRKTFGPPAAFKGITAAETLSDLKRQHGADYPVGARRSGFADAPVAADVPLEAMIEREPITVVCSQMGWVRAMKGHIALDSELKFKDGDGPKFIFHAETTDRLVVFGTNGRFYTVPASNLPGGRGMGEPIRLMVDLPNEAEILAMFAHKQGRKLLVASSAGDGFVVPEEDVIAQTRSGKQVLNVRDARAVVCRPVDGDHVAVVGENRKVLVFPLDELPEMGRGKGVRLQKYKDGGLSDARTFNLADGLQWKDGGGRQRTETELGDFTGKRAGTGRMAPRGFPRDNKFTD
ncbi:DNA topoisomerase IV subunit A [Pontivivens insulae]|uniref:DNA topoisomerase 4 subunit A n=1 Tax=Pontivivens insulae TaxID=1639689 RepID=A0A2R8ABR3_9RHOB|nr:DNA topoisomerase IV subunit A [Pontivivens insulae]RED11150.1 DNA topoisomerase IV subunit A [Pontivivens insulae]SPF29676.1 DNA topoisomerase 4 subunit A [Pontivivens insulae]